MRLPLVLALALLAAGCASSDPASPSPSGLPTAVPDWHAKVIAYGEGHDHRDWSQHVNMSTPNFEILAYDPLGTELYGGDSAVGYFCGGNATTSDGRKLAVISSLDSDVAFVLVDVTDPAAPQKLGEYVIQGTTHYDVDITADGKYVVIGSDVNLNPTLPVATDGLTDLGASLPVPTVTPVWRDACGNERRAGPEEQVPLAPATLLVDVTDPTNPVLADALPAPLLGPHSVSTATIDGAYYVAASITNLAQPVDYFQFMRIEELPTGARLVQFALIDGAAYGAGGTAGGHVDADVAKHPVTGQLLGYLSNWDGGMVIVDLGVPGVPTLVGEWADTGASGGALHSTRVVDGLWGDRHYVIAGQEFVARPEDRGSGWIYVIDDTDPTNPVEVSRWTLPLDTELNWAGPDSPCCLETWSTHYFRLVDQTLFVAMYHAGVWAVDLTDPTAPRSIGAFVPDQAPPSPRRDPVGVYDLTPFVLDVFPQPDYTMSIFDGYSGLYSVKFDPTAPAPLVTEWPMAGATHEDG